VIDWQDWMTVTDARALFADHPGVPVAVLTDDTSPDCVRGLVETGVFGVIPRSTDPRLIVRALELVLLGGHYIPPGALALEPPVVTISAVASTPETTGETGGNPGANPGGNPAAAALPVPVEGALRRPEPFAPPARRTRFAGGLSPRQEQIMRCVHMGSTNKMIARALGISEGTVKIHLTSIFQQLGAPNRAAAVAIYNGWLNAQLEVLRTSQESAERPVRGQPGVVPLRRRTRRKFKYPLPANDTATPLPMAAEATVPFDEAAPAAPPEPANDAANDAGSDAGAEPANPPPASTQKGEAADAPCDGWHGIRSHVSPPNE
jgi:DNA-binding NarL/FixJ family response regulator